LADQYRRALTAANDRAAASDDAEARVNASREAREHALALSSASDALARAQDCAPALRERHLAGTSRRFEEGDVVALANALWLARDDTSSKPEDGSPMWMWMAEDWDAAQFECEPGKAS